MKIEEMKQLANDIRDTLAKLNELNKKAYDADLSVDYVVDNFNGGFGPEEIILSVSISVGL